MMNFIKGFKEELEKEKQEEYPISFWEYVIVFAIFGLLLFQF